LSNSFHIALIDCPAITALNLLYASTQRMDSLLVALSKSTQIIKSLESCVPASTGRPGDSAIVMREHCSAFYGLSTSGRSQKS